MYRFVLNKSGVINDIVSMSLKANLLSEKIKERIKSKSFQFLVVNVLTLLEYDLQQLPPTVNIDTFKICNFDPFVNDLPEGSEIEKAIRETFFKIIVACQIDFEKCKELDFSFILKHITAGNMYDSEVIMALHKWNAI